MGVRAMTSAERQRRYRQRKRRMAAFGVNGNGEIDLARFPGITAADLTRAEARPREPGEWGLALAAAERLVALKIEAIKAEERVRSEMAALWSEARSLIAAEVTAQGEGTAPRQRADSLLRRAVEHAVEWGEASEYDLRPQDVWGRLRLSTHRAR